MSWDQRFLELAQHVSTWSKDPSTKVGAVIVNDERVVIGLGYNGFPRGVDDSPERYANRETKYKLIVHAEVNAILNATASVRGATLYIWPFMPCERCAGVVIQSGIGCVVSVTNDNARWATAFETTQLMFREAGVGLDLR